MALTEGLCHGMQMGLILLRNWVWVARAQERCPLQPATRLETRSVSSNTEESLTAMAVLTCLQEGRDELCPRP